jgi:two-component system sensor histidine kinase CpxA
MRSLFIKIFVWFWLANTLVAAAVTLAMGAGFGRSTPRFDIVLSSMLMTYGQGAVAILEHDGPTALREHVRGVHDSLHYAVFLYNDRGEELSGGSAPAGARELALRVARSGSTSESVPDPAALMAVKLRGSQGRGYVAVAHLAPGPFGYLTAGSRPVVLQLITIVLTAGVVCYGLSRYLTGPLRKLRTAAQQLAQGDMTVRAGTGNRRDEIGQLGRDFDFMAERLESLMASQQRLLRDMSHELRSPLARLNVALELAAQRSGPDANDALDRIGREARRLNGLIGELLTLSRLEASQKVADKTTIDLAELVRQIVADADFEAMGSGRRVRLDRCDGCAAAGTLELVRSAIENVIRNGIRYTAEGTQVDVELACEPRDGESQAVIRVRDHGPGVPQDSIKDIFRPFYRVGDHRDRQTGGVGLGLAIAQQAMRLHGGTISAINAPGGGLVVELRLPATIRGQELRT